MINKELPVCFILYDLDFLNFIPALTHLDKIKVYGKPIRVAPSRHQVVQMPKDGQPVSIIFSLACKNAKEVGNCLHIFPVQMHLDLFYSCTWYLNFYISI